VTVNLPDTGRRSVTVAASNPYEVVVEPALHLASTLNSKLRPVGGGGVAALLTDSTVGPLHAPSVAESLEEAGWDVRTTVTVAAGESSKSLAVYGEALGQLARAGMPRSGTLFALGGGVVGDLGGFVAASYMRGIAFVQLPTTLLAMVDSSVGGKVGLDLPEGKNLVGAFHQPRLVAANLDWLSTLPPRELSGGLAEVVKMGLLSGGEFLRELVERLPAAREGDAEALRALILYSVRYKARVVAEDEREAGLRAVLNYGHTIGHGLEAAASYGLPHGEAVAIGMLAAARLSQTRFGTDLLGLHEGLIKAAGLPRKARPLDPDAVLAAMRRDKKRAASDRPDEYRFVLLRGVGDPIPGVPVSEREARDAIGAVLER
jgi:3-dehydroquinate synthase